MIQLVEIRDGKTVTTSRMVAEKFGKQHKNIIRDVKNLDCSDKFSALNFEPRDYTDPRGKRQTEYIITKDGFTFLVMGFRGAQAAKFKEDYINEFNRREEIIKEMKSPRDHLDALEIMIKGMRAQQNQIDNVKQDVKVLQAQSTTRPDYFTIAGYANLNNHRINLKIAGSIGRKAASICRKRSIPMDTMPDPRFGKVRLYPIGILSEVFAEAI